MNNSTMVVAALLALAALLCRTFAIPFQAHLTLLSHVVLGENVLHMMVESSTITSWDFNLLLVMLPPVLSFSIMKYLAMPTVY